MGEQRWWSWCFIKCCSCWFDEEDQAADMDIHHEEQPATNFGAGTSAGDQGDEMPSMSSFERYTVNRLDGFAENQRNLHDLCVSNFQTIDNRFNNMDLWPWMNKLKLFRIRSLNSSMARMIKGKTTGWMLKTTDCFCPVSA